MVVCEEVLYDPDEYFEELFPQEPSADSASAKIIMIISQKEHPEPPVLRLGVLPPPEPFYTVFKDSVSDIIIQKNRRDQP